MTTALVLAFLAAAIPAFFTPGPNNLMLMASTARFGLRPTIPHMLGICFGFPVMVFAVGLGLGEIFTQYPWLKDVLKYVAAATFLWMAWTMLGLKLGPADANERPMRFAEAALFQWVNPKAWALAVSFVAVLVPAGDARFGALAFVTIGSLIVSPFSAGLWMVFGQELNRLLIRHGLERFLGIIMAGLMLVAVVLFLL